MLLGPEILCHWWYTAVIDSSTVLGLMVLWIANYGTTDFFFWATAGYFLQLYHQLSCTLRYSGFPLSSCSLFVFHLPLPSCSLFFAFTWHVLQLEHLKKEQYQSNNHTVSVYGPNAEFVDRNVTLNCHRKNKPEQLIQRSRQKNKTEFQNNRMSNKKKQPTQNCGKVGKTLQRVTRN